MLNTGRFVLIALVTGASSCAPPDRSVSQATGGMASPLVGTWTLRAVEMTDPSGRPVDGPRAVGTIIYTREGRMATQSMVVPRPVVPPVPEGPGEVAAWSPEQARQVVETYDAYFGTYEVDEANHTVTHHVEGELRPNLVGAAYLRRYQVNGDRLLLSSANPDERWRVVWERVK